MMKESVRHETQRETNRDIECKKMNDTPHPPGDHHLLQSLTKYFFFLQSVVSH
jgi:hypothetical protein